MRLRLVLLAIVAIMLPVVTVNAQEKTKAALPRGAKARGLDVARAVQETKSGYSNASLEVLDKVKKAYSDSAKDSSQDRRLTGTWFVTVPLDETTVFHAFHTFGNDGTFVETSSLLGTLIEGPAHGVWENSQGGALLTFEVFEFDPDGNEIGRVRVRNFIQLTDSDHFTADSVVDFIELNGDVIEGIATGTYTAQRMHVRGL